MIMSPGFNRSHLLNPVRNRGNWMLVYTSSAFDKDLRVNRHSIHCRKSFIYLTVI